MRGRRGLIVAVALVGIAVVVGILANRRHEPAIGRGGSTALASGQPVAINRTPQSYLIEYRLEEKLTDAVRVSTERVWVRRPFESRRELRAGPPPGTRREEVDVTTLGRDSMAHINAEPLVSEQPPGQPSDLRLSASLTAAIHDGDVTRRERRRVADRVCQVYRTKSRLNADTFTAPTATNYVDSCVDRDGLLLEELQVTAGKRQVRRVAVRVELRPSLTDSMFEVGKATIDVTHGGGSTRPVDPTSSPPGKFWLLDAAPPGYTLVGRFSVVPPQAENFSDPLREDFQRAAVSDVFVRGVDVIVVERGGTLRNQPPWQVDPANPGIDLGALGRGEILRSGHGAEVRVLTKAFGGGRYVRVFGTRPVDELAAIARQLHVVDGTQLRFLDQ